MNWINGLLVKDLIAPGCKKFATSQSTAPSTRPIAKSNNIPWGWDNLPEMFNRLCNTGHVHISLVKEVPNNWMNQTLNQKRIPLNHKLHKELHKEQQNTAFVKTSSKSKIWGSFGLQQHLNRMSIKK